MPISTQDRPSLVTSDKLFRHLTRLSLSSYQWITDSFRYTLRDPRKRLSLLFIMVLPFVYNAWRAVPKEIAFGDYYDLRVFTYQFASHFMLLLVSCAWFSALPRRDFAMQIIVSGAIFIGIFICIDMLPILDGTPLWMDLMIVAGVYGAVGGYLFYVHHSKRNTDYKILYDGILHELHHSQVLGSVARIEGLLLSPDADQYKHLTLKELDSLKKAVGYLSEKYRDID